MALPTTVQVPLSPHVIGNAFVEQYYRILHRAPDQVYRFYQDSSILARPDSSGNLASVTTMHGISEKIQSQEFNSYFTEIETADSYLSYMNGVFILVTGSLTGPDNVRRKFIQSFCLAPQENGGYFVFNDVLRFLTVTDSVGLVSVSDAGESATEPHITTVSETEPAQVNETEMADPPVVSNADADISDEVFDLSENGGSVVADEIPPGLLVSLSKEETAKATAAAPSSQNNAPKKSYASIVKVTSPAVKPVQVVSNPKQKTKAVEKTEKPLPSPVKQTMSQETETATAPSSNNSESNSPDVQGYSIYIRNLPGNANVETVEQEFKKFGPIRSNGVQIRFHKIERYYFGFVEFESEKSVHDAIKASPVTLGGRQVYVEEKRTTTRVVNGVITHGENSNMRTGLRGPPPPPPARVSFRNDGFRGGRAPPPASRGRSRAGPPPAGLGRGRDGYQAQHRVYQNVNGPFGRPNGGPTQTPVTA